MSIHVGCGIAPQKGVVTATPCETAFLIVLVSLSKSSLYFTYLMYTAEELN